MRKRISIILSGLLLFGLLNCQAQSAETIVQIDTDLGKIKVKLYDDTPQHRDNFIKLVKEGNYDGVLFHRVIKQFMIQAGDINSKHAAPDAKLGDGDVGYTVPAEIVYPKYFHKRGKLCAARMGDDVNPERASSGSHFYIVTGKHFTESELDAMDAKRAVKLTPEQREAYMLEGGVPHLDGAYTVFGEVIKGMNVVDKIQQVETDANDRPKKDVRIKSMKIVRK